MLYSGLAIIRPLLEGGASNATPMLWATDRSKKKLAKLSKPGDPAVSVIINLDRIYSEEETAAFFSTLGVAQPERLPEYSPMEAQSLLTFLLGAGATEEGVDATGQVRLASPDRQRFYKIPIAGDAIPASTIIDCCNALNVPYPPKILEVERPVMDIRDLVAELQKANPEVAVDRGEGATMVLRRPLRGLLEPFSVNVEQGGQITSSEVVRYCTALRLDVPEPLKPRLALNFREKDQARKVKAHVLGATQIAVQATTRALSTRLAEDRFSDSGEDEDGGGRLTISEADLSELEHAEEESNEDSSHSAGDIPNSEGESAESDGDSAEEV